MTPKHSVADYEAAGLYDHEQHAGTNRLELLNWLGSLGVTIETMVGGDAAGLLPNVAGDQRILGGSLISRADAVAASELDELRFDQLVSGLGFVALVGAPPGELGFTEAEAAMLHSLGALTDIFTDDDAQAFVRVVGDVFGRLGEAGVSMFLADVERRMLADGHDEYEIARVGYDAIGLVDGFTELVEPVFRRHLMQATSRSRSATIGEDERIEYRYAVGFVDLVGFTERSVRMSAPELARFLRDFERRAHDVVTSKGARVVKMIGDEVMFTGTDADAVCAASIELMDGFSAGADEVVPRGGIAFGNVVTQGGDYFGPVVNLAARLVDHAVPREILVSEELAVAATGFGFEPAGRRTVKGFGEPVTVLSLAVP